MTVTFRCAAELDLGQQASVEVTSEFYRELLNEVLEAGDSVVLLRGEITSDCASPPISDRINVKQGAFGNTLVKLGRRAQAGYRMAVILSNAGAGLRILESRGYERCAFSSPESLAVIQGWIAWLGRNIPEVQGALIFGHDYSPVFIFENIVVK
jgi:hypothetical protein